jgi:DNA-binding LytR/AlgR family response regulator
LARERPNSTSAPAAASLYAVVNVNAFEEIDPSLLRRTTSSFEGEEKENRLARRKRNWIANIKVIERG